MAKPPTVAQGLYPARSGILETIGEGNANIQWLEWLNNNDSFRYCPKSSDAPYTVRKERSKRGEADYWYGYRKIDGKLHKRYVGKTPDLTTERLEEIAKQLNEPSTPRLAKVTDKTTIQPVTVTDESTKLHKQIAGLTAQLTELQAKAEKLQNEKQALQAELTELHKQLPKNQLDYEAKRDRILASWKVGKRAESKERIKEAIDRFIGLLVELPSKPETATPQIKAKSSWESKVESFLGEVSWHG